EKLIRLNRCFVCCGALLDGPDVEALPALERKAVTFGSFNFLPKINERVLDAWAKLLRRVEGSRLLLKSAGMGQASVQERIRAALAARGVEAARIELIGKVAGHARHLGYYGKVDIALDTFPYNGT